jgi:hypothetical protein
MFLSKNWLILYLDYKHAIIPNFFHQIILIVFWYPGHPHGSFYTQLFKIGRLLPSVSYACCHKKLTATLEIVIRFILFY